MIPFDILGHKSFKAVGYPKMYPLSLTLGLTYKCNSRCKTCNIWGAPNNNNELRLCEYIEIFRSFKKLPYALILTGGEPFLRDDIIDICKEAVKNLKPRIIIIPTNGVLTKKILEDVKRILNFSLGTKIAVNISLDGIKQDNDEIRGVEGGFDKAMETYRCLREIKNKSLELKIHTVVSIYNIGRIFDIYRYFRDVANINSYIAEISQERAELRNIGAKITPSIPDYSKAINLLSKGLREEKFKGFLKIVQAFRLEYYQLTKHILEEKRQVIPCYAGFASAQINPQGDILFCATKEESIGNLRENGYNFGKIWFSEKANEFRIRLKNKECYCPLASIAYINMVSNLSSLLRVLLRFIKLQV